MSRRGQKWVLDALIAKGGRDILHPESNPFLEQMGYDHSDIDAVFKSVKCIDLQPKAWARRGAELARRAGWAEQRGYRLGAYHMYHRAALAFSRAQRDLKTNQALKEVLHARLVECYERANQFAANPVERVRLPFEGKHLYGVFHKHPHLAKPPVILLIPGMDMTKEDWHRIAQTYVLPSGFAALAIDGPGQGESLLHGLHVTQDNYERAGQAFIDYLLTRPDVDANGIVLIGVSAGSYWGTRLAGYDHRLRAAVTALGCYGAKDTWFNVAQPSFKKNYMYMAGISDEGEFDRFIEGMVLTGIARGIKCPFLIAQGEIDELSPVADVYQFYASLQCPKEIWIYEEEFHPMGNVSAEVFPAFVGWLRDKIDRPAPRDLDKKTFIRKGGYYDDGQAMDFWLK